MSDGKPDAVFDALDALNRARRDALRPDEARALAQALATSALVRTARDVGRGFDLESGVRAGDDALIARAAAATLAARPRRRSARTRWLLGVAATWLVGTAAAASVAVVVARGHNAEVARNVPGARRDSQTPAHGARKALAARNGTATDGHERDEAGSNDDEHGAMATDGHERGETATNGDAPATNGDERGETSPHVAEHYRGHIVPPPASATHASSARTGSAGVPGALGASVDRAPPAASGAAELFRAASAARRSGDLVRARALYAELQTRFPHTSEARVSLVSLGTLLLAAGRAGEAETAFGAYLDGGRGDLTEEALVGRAGACAALGRHADERRAWTELVDGFPTSVYVARAKARLVALEPASHATAGTH